MNEKLRALVLEGRVAEAHKLAGEIVTATLPETEANMCAATANKKESKRRR